DIAKISTVSPTAVIATALLSHRGRGMPQSRMLATGLRMIEFLDDNAARLSEALLNVNEDGRKAALLKAAESLAKEGMIVAEQAGKTDAELIYRVPEERRILLDYHKNALMNYFAPASLVARSLRRHGLSEVSQDAMREDVKFLSRSFKREFLFRADSGFDVHFEDVVASLVLLGIVDFDEAEGTVSALDGDGVETLARLIDGVIEAYWSTLQSVEQIAETPLPEKELKDRALERIRRAFLEGEISRPEAANQTVVATALSWLQSEGHLSPTDPNNRKSALKVEDPTKLADLRARLDLLR
ncbi:MAG: hypothetical protein AAF658_04675, partial [Myxococcota bacterium]